MYNSLFKIGNRVIGISDTSIKGIKGTIDYISPTPRFYGVIFDGDSKSIGVSEYEIRLLDTPTCIGDDPSLSCETDS